ncbi:hypothetical protein OG407_47320 [Streptomyces sp. NBC_01515]|uniref:hypothetical protein n=1 Tax=Streptomyces sp. NBC_01515 TaxID=2903890 RepID=UPI003863F9EA
MPARRWSAMAMAMAMAMASCTGRIRWWYDPPTDATGARHEPGERTSHAHLSGREREFRPAHPEGTYTCR